MTAARKFRKKPVVIEAIQWTGGNRTTIHEFCGAYVTFGGVTMERLHLATLEGVLTATEGDWIIRGIQGEFYPCKPDIFEQTYETVD